MTHWSARRAPASWQIGVVSDCSSPQSKHALWEFIPHVLHYLQIQCLHVKIQIWQPAIHLAEVETSYKLAKQAWYRPLHSQTFCTSVMGSSYDRSTDVQKVSRVSCWHSRYSASQMCCCIWLLSEFCRHTKYCYSITSIAMNIIAELAAVATWWMHCHQGCMAQPKVGALHKTCLAAHACWQGKVHQQVEIILW